MLQLQLAPGPMPANSERYTSIATRRGLSERASQQASVTAPLLSQPYPPAVLWLSCALFGSFLEAMANLIDYETHFGEPPPLPDGVEIRLYSMAFCPFAEVSVRSMTVMNDQTRFRLR